MDSNEQQTGGNKNLPAFIAIAGLIAIVGLFILKPGKIFINITSYAM